jgi:hypothetical protein
MFKCGFDALEAFTNSIANLILFIHQNNKNKIGLTEKEIAFLLDIKSVENNKLKGIKFVNIKEKMKIYPSIINRYYKADFDINKCTNWKNIDNIANLRNELVHGKARAFTENEITSDVSAGYQFSATFEELTDLIFLIESYIIQILNLNFNELTKSEFYLMHYNCLQKLMQIFNKKQNIWKKMKKII